MAENTDFSDVIRIDDAMRLDKTIKPLPPVICSIAEYELARLDDAIESQYVFIEWSPSRVRTLAIPNAFTKKEDIEKELEIIKKHEEKGGVNITIKRHKIGEKHEGCEKLHEYNHTVYTIKRKTNN